MQCVLLETPCSGNEHPIFYERYAKACIRDSLLRNEAPLSAFLLYKQSGILNNFISSEQILGRLAQSEWSKFCKKIIVYKDLGLTKEMQINIDSAVASNKIVEYRILNDSQFKKEPIVATINTFKAANYMSKTKNCDLPDFLTFI
jgi:hypothetical protein